MHRLSLFAASSSCCVCCRGWASHCSDFSRGAQPLASWAAVAADGHSGVAECRLQCVDSMGVSQGLSYSVACEILLGQRSNLCPINRLADSYPLYHQGSLSLIQFEFTFVYGVRRRSSLILLHEALQFSQQHLLKRLPFSPLYILTFLAVGLVTI